MNNLLFIFVAFILLASTSCSNDKNGENPPSNTYYDGIYQNITGTEKLKLVLTLDGKNLTGKSVEVKGDVNGEKATLTLVDILPNQASPIIINVALTTADNKYTFSGTATMTNAKVRYSGSIFKASIYDDSAVLTLDLVVDK